VRNIKRKKERATVIVETNDGILLISHTKKGKPWYMLPGGRIKIEKGEQPISAAVRKLKGKTGLESKEIKYLFDFKTKNYIHKVYLVKQRGTIHKGKKITHIRYYNDETKNKLHFTSHVKPVIERYYKDKQRIIDTPTISKDTHSYKKPIKSDKHKPLFSVFKKHSRKYHILRKLKYKIRKTHLPTYFLISLIAMILIGIIHQFFIISIATIDLSFFFYIFELIVVGYIILWLLKKFDRIKVHSDMRLFGLRILSGILSFIGLYLLFMFMIFGFPIIFSSPTSLKQIYSLMGLGGIYSVFSFGEDFRLPLTGVIVFLGIILGLVIIGGYLFFKFKRRTGPFVWFGRA